jgi:GNAT superfamily N-acetyltransferase
MVVARVHVRSWQAAYRTLLPEQLWGRGIGVALVAAACARLWAVAGNVRADRFYQMDGWAPDGLSRTDSMWGVTVNDRYQHGLETPSFTGQRKDPPLFPPLP